MRWSDLRRSKRVEDRRDDVGGRGGLSPTGMGGRGTTRGGAMPLAGAGGCGFLAIVVLIMLLGGDPSALIGGLTEGPGSLPVDVPAAPQRQPPPGAAAEGDAEDVAADFAAAILGSTEDVWGKLFAAAGYDYREPVLVLFTDITPTACGTGEAATGPFYCPGDQKLYLDLGFLNELQRLGAPGDFAVAYVIAHEVGHHVQHLEGTDVEVRRAQARVSRADANALSVLMELQADCYAGVWAYHADAADQVLEEGDIEEGLAAAAAVGDDRLMRMAGRPVRPDAFTHGSSEERMAWLRRGLESGDTNACDTFEAAGLR